MKIIDLEKSKQGEKKEHRTDKTNRKHKAGW